MIIIKFIILIVVKEVGVGKNDPYSFSSIFLIKASKIHFIRISIELNSSKFLISLIEISAEVIQEKFFWYFL